MEVEEAVLGSPSPTVGPSSSLIVPTVPMDVKQHCVEGCRPGLPVPNSRAFPVPNSPYGPHGRKATLNLNCVEVEEAVLGSPSLTVGPSPSLIVPTVPADVKQH